MEVRGFQTWLESDLDQHYGWWWECMLLRLAPSYCVVTCLPQSTLKPRASITTTTDGYYLSRDTGNKDQVVGAREYTATGKTRHTFL